MCYYHVEFLCAQMPMCVHVCVLVLVCGVVRTAAMYAHMYVLVHVYMCGLVPVWSSVYTAAM